MMVYMRAFMHIGEIGGGGVKGIVGRRRNKGKGETNKKRFDVC